MLHSLLILSFITVIAKRKMNRASVGLSEDLDPRELGIYGNLCERLMMSSRSTRSQTTTSGS